MTENKTAPILLAAAVVCLVALTAWYGLSARSAGTLAEAGPSRLPAPDPIAQAAALDSVRLLGAVSVLAHDSMEGRATGTPGSERARAFLLRQLASTGVTPEGGRFEHPFTWADHRSGVNLLGRVEGASSTPVIVLTAHYDHVGIRDGETFNGADDNASGTAAVLEIARILVDRPPEHTVIIALLDAEEIGLRGARAFVESPPIAREDIALNVNLDMVSRSGGTLWASGASHTPALRPVLEDVAAEAPVTLRLGHDRPGAPEGDDWTGSSDHAPFHAAGIPFVYFGVEDHRDYHRPTDDYGAIDPGEFMSSVHTILAALRALDAALPLPPTENAR